MRKVTANPRILGRHIHESWATSWGELNDTFVLTDGRELPLNSRFTATIVKRGDIWHVAAFHVSVNAFSNPIMTLAIKKTAMLSGIVGAVIGLLAGVIGLTLLRRQK